MQPNRVPLIQSQSLVQMGAKVTVAVAGLISLGQHPVTSIVAFTTLPVWHDRLVISSFSCYLHREISFKHTTAPLLLHQGCLNPIVESQTCRNSIKIHNIMSHDAQTIRLEIQSISSDSGSEALMADIVHEERDTPLRKTEETINENIVSSLPRRSLVRRRTEDWVRSSSECEPLHPRNPAKRIKLARQPAPVITSDVPTFPTTAATPGLTKTGKPLSMSSKPYFFLTFTLLSSALTDNHLLVQRPQSITVNGKPRRKSTERDSWL